jgi:hypothetical protein
MMIASGCCEVWETQRVFQGAVVKSKTCPWPRHLSAAGGSKREFKLLSVSKSLTRSGGLKTKHPGVGMRRINASICDENQEPMNPVLVQVVDIARRNTRKSNLPYNV